MCVCENLTHFTCVTWLSHGHFHSGALKYSMPTWVTGEDRCLSAIISVHAKSLQSCPTLWIYGLPGSSLRGDSPTKNTGVGCHALFQGIFLTQGSGTRIFCISKQILYHWCYLGRPSTIACAMLCLVAQLCPTLCESMDYSPPSSSVHGSSPARILEWVAMPSSKGSSHALLPEIKPRSPAWQADSLPAELPGKPLL